MSIDPSVDSSCEDRVLGHSRSLYEHAVLHILVGVAAKKWQLLFAFIELLPLEVPPPHYDGVIEGPRLKKSNCRIFADHVPMSSAQALVWYRDARGGRVVRPAPDGSVPCADDPKAVICQPLGWNEEPVWPGYVLADSAHRLPFLNQWHATPRIHHLMPSTTAWCFLPEESAIVDEFLLNEVGFRRSDWLQLAESIHLVAPNPYYRDFEEWLVNGPSSSLESVSIKIQPRNRVVVPPLEVDLVEHRPTGRCTAATIPLDAQPRTTVPGPPLHETSTTVRLLSGGLLETRPPAPFMREMHVTMEVMHGSRIVTVSDSLGKELERYHVAVAHPNTTGTGSSAVAGATRALTMLMNEVSIRDAARQLEQRWFTNDPDAARNFVRSLIRPARDQVLIADPYLGGVEIQRYALAVARSSVPVRLLTTRDGFDSAFTAPVLERNIARWQATEPSLGPIELRVMERGQLHDRFLRVDGRLYTLGNSLNHLGKKGSLIMRIPDPGPVFSELERIWRSADTLSDVAAAQK